MNNPGKNRIIPFKILSDTDSSSKVFTTSREQVLIKSPKLLNRRQSLYNFQGPKTPSSTLLKPSKSIPDLNTILSGMSNSYTPTSGSLSSLRPNSELNTIDSSKLFPNHEDNLNRISSLRYFYTKPKKPEPLSRKGTFIYPDTIEETAELGGNIEEVEEYKEARGPFVYSSIKICQGSIPSSSEHCQIAIFGSLLYLIAANSSNAVLETRVLDLQNSVWRIIKAKNPPRKRFGFSLAKYKKKVVLFGGWEVGGELVRKMSRKMLVFNADDNTWEKTMGLGDIPNPIKNHSSCQMGTTMIIYGGEDAKGAIQSKLFTLNLPDLRWKEIVYSIKNAPGARSHASLTPVFENGANPGSRNSLINKLSSKNSGFYLFGGIDHEKNLCNKVYVLSIRNQEFVWSLANTTGNKPCPRYSHSATSIGFGLFVFGGRNDKTSVSLNDFYMLNTNTLRWEEYSIKHNLPPGRYNSCLSPISPSCLLLLGGLTYKTLLSSDIFTLELSKSEYKKKAL